MLSFSDIWEKSVELLADQVSAVALNTWIKSLIPVKITTDRAVLQVQTAFQKEVIEGRYLELLKDSLTAVLGFEVEVEIVMASEPPEKAPEKEADYEYTFATFIVGNSNKFAHAASMAVAQMPATAYNPLFIYGGSGLGKTHLLYAIQNEILTNFPNYKVVYLRGDDFTNELIESIQRSTVSQFRNKYRYADVLLIDDIQFIGGKESTQEEFFHTFNTLHAAKKQIVLTSDRPPKEIQTLEERLRTRFEWGLIADIQPPDYETRIAIARRKAESLNLPLSDEVVSFLATNLKDNIRQLEGAVKNVKASSALDNGNITLAMAQRAIKDILSSDSAAPLSADKIIDSVAAYYNISPEEIKGKKRTAEIAMARQVSMYLTRELTDQSLPFIGAQFGGKDHSTVMHAIRKVEDMVSVNPGFKNTMEDLKKNILDGRKV